MVNSFLRISQKTFLTTRPFFTAECGKFNFGWASTSAGEKGRGGRARNPTFSQSDANVNVCFLFDLDGTEAVSFTYRWTRSFAIIISHKPPWIMHIAASWKRSKLKTPISVGRSSVRSTTRLPAGVYKCRLALWEDISSV